MTTKEAEKVRVLRKGNCPSLSGRSELKYEFGFHNKSVLFRITKNSGEGHFQEAWIPLDAILQLLTKQKGPFSLNVFKSLYTGSINNVGFLGAALKKEGLIICEKRQYIQKDIKLFLADINKLTKPARKANKTKEEPK